MTIPDKTAGLRAGDFDLTHVIKWLEAGCDPMKAAGELRLYLPKHATLRASLAEAEARIEGMRKALGPADDWAEKLAELYSWSGSAFLAGEKVRDEAGHKSRLYSFLCDLIGFLAIGERTARQAFASLEPKETGDAR